jgi:hypothetical protein
MMTHGYDRPLYVLPFDHRGSFETGMFGWKGALTLEQTAQIAAAKQVIYDGFKAAVAAGVPKDRAGILVDEQFGAAVLRDAAAQGYLTACPAEKSGQEEFDFEYGEDFAKHIEAFHPTFCKVLVRYNPEGDQALNRRQSARLNQAEQAGADRIDVDVMDGDFVPNLSMGAPIVASLRRVTCLPLEIHLMISDPDFFLDEFVEAGSDSFLVHWEGNVNLHRTRQRIKALGKRAGVVINPATPAAVLEEILQDVEQAVIMTVNPRFRASAFHSHDAAQDPACPSDDRAN